MPTTVRGGIPYIELNELKYSFGTEDATVVRYCEVTGDNLSGFRNAMLGHSRMDDTTLRRSVPEAHPRWDWLYAQQLEFVDPFAIPSQDAAYSDSLWYGKHKVAVTYKTLPYVVRDDDYVEQLGATRELHRYFAKMETLTVESMQIPIQMGFYFEDAAGYATATPIPENPSIILPAGMLVLNWYQVPAVNDTFGMYQVPGGLLYNINNCMGKTNNAEFMGNYPKHTLLCVAPEIMPVRQPNGEWAFNIKYSLAIRGRKDVTGTALGSGAATPDWDRIWKPTASSATPWYKVVRAGATTTSIYEDVSFDTLFKFSTV